MRVTLAAAILLLSSSLAFADPVGHYAVAGANPGGDGKYSGEVTVEKTGDTYKRLFGNGLSEFATRDSSLGCGPERRAAGWRPLRRRPNAIRAI
jgi:hypothetical protein